MLEIDEFSTALLDILKHKSAKYIKEVTDEDIQAFNAIIRKLEKSEKLPPEFIMNQERFILSVISINNKLKPNPFKSFFRFIFRHEKEKNRLHSDFMLLGTRLLRMKRINVLFDTDAKASVVKKSFLDNALKISISRKLKYDEIDDCVSECQLDDDLDLDLDADDKPTKVRAPVIYDRLPTIVYSKIPNFSKSEPQVATTPLSKYEMLEERNSKHLAQLHALAQAVPSAAVLTFETVIISQAQMQEFKNFQPISLLDAGEYFIRESDHDPNYIVLQLQNGKQGSGYEPVRFDREGYDNEDQHIDDYLHVSAQHLKLDRFKPVYYFEL